MYIKQQEICLLYKNVQNGHIKSTLFLIVSTMKQLKISIDIAREDKRITYLIC